MIKYRYYSISLSIALIGFIIRLFIGIEGIHGTDILFHVEGVRSLILTGSPYCLANYNYPPLYAYLQLIGILAIGWNTLGYKIMSILFDVALSILIYATLRSLGVDERVSIVIQSLWCFNPLAIVTSSWYGLFDSIPTLFSLLSLLMMIKRRTVISALALSLGIASKFFPIIFLPINLFIISVRERKIGSIGRYFLLVLLIISSIELVSISRCLDDAIKDQFLFHINREDKGLSLIPWFPYSSLLSLVIPMILSLLLLLYTKSISLINIYAIATIESLALILLNPFVYPHYIIWSLPLMLITLPLIVHSITKVFILGITLTTIFSMMGLGYWRLYKVPSIAITLSYIYNLCSLTILLGLLKLYPRLVNR